MRDLVSAEGGGWYDIGTIYNVAYPVSGCSCNWVYGVEERWSFAIEVVDADMPEICQEFLTSQLLLGQWIAETDCNGNGVDDDEDVTYGTSEDVNGNGVPDECECPADVNGDYDVNTADLLILLGNWGSAGAGDIDADGAVDTADLLLLLAAWGACP
jgi:hypothetical protein